MNKIINRWLVITAVLSAIFAVCLWHHRDAQGNTEYYEGSNHVEMCEYIELDMLKTNVELIPYNGNDIKFEYKSLVPIEVLLGDNRLVVNESDELKVAFLESEGTQLGFKLYLPKKSYRSMIIYTSSGNVGLSSVKCDAINVTTNSGSIASLDTNSVVHLVSGSGDILLDFNEVIPDCSIENRNGNVEIRFTEDSSVALSYETETGHFRSDLLDANIRGSYMYSFSGGENLITADVSHGILTVNEKSTAQYKEP